MRLVWVVALLLAGSSRRSPGQDFQRHSIADGLQERITGAALVGPGRLATWGDRLVLWDLPEGKPSQVASPDGGFGEGGCTADVDGDGRVDLVLQESAGLGKLVWRRAPGWERTEVDTDVEMHDCRAATLDDRRGVLTVHRYGQVRFYAFRDRAYREVYSFYTPSRQAGLAIADVDSDGEADILCGNYWIRNPGRFDLPWRLFAINTYSETPESAMLRLEAIGEPFGVIASQGELTGGRLAFFRRPEAPTDLWRETRLDAGPPLDRPHALAAGDFDGDGDTDFVVGENGGGASRLLLYLNEGDGRFRPRPAGQGPPAHTALAADVDGDGRLDVLTVGRDGLAWWKNQRRK